MDRLLIRGSRQPVLATDPNLLGGQMMRSILDSIKLIATGPYSLLSMEWYRSSPSSQTCPSGTVITRPCRGARVATMSPATATIRLVTICVLNGDRNVTTSPLRNSSLLAHQNHLFSMTQSFCSMFESGLNVGFIEIPSMQAILAT